MLLLMITIYKIEDKDGLKYVGSTCRTTSHRLNGHRTDKKRGRPCSSGNLDLDNCTISVLEKCDENKRNEREQYWIDNTDCVNKYNTTHDPVQYRKDYIKKNKEHLAHTHHLYHIKNRDKILNYKKNLRIYQNSWGEKICNNCNLLNISIDLFK